MGLDMYLYEVPKQYDTDLYKSDAEVDELPPEATRIDFSAEPPLTRYYFKDGARLVAQWRKANQVHHWFVVNVQKGVDECEPHIVHPEMLADLYQRCIQVRDDPSKAAEVLPSVGGFFFGSTDYDDWYRSDIEDTITQLDRVRADRKPDTNLVYLSSW